VVPLLTILCPLLQITHRLKLGPLVLVRQGRVAIGDPVGAALQSKLTLVLIGERPGLSAADSVGAYLTYGPAPGLTDESRNCVSNIRPGGLSFHAAAIKLAALIITSLQKQLSGIQLKDADETNYGGAMLDQ
jgi:ethanolamine ammonia-lyase small subunit